MKAPDYTSPRTAPGPGAASIASALPFTRGQETLDEVPMPSRPAKSGTRVLERFVLQSLGCKSHLTAVLQQSLAIGGNEMRHRHALEEMPMQPEAPVHREYHPIAPALELTVRTRLQSVPAHALRGRNERSPRARHEGHTRAASPTVIAPTDRRSGLPS